MRSLSVLLACACLWLAGCASTRFTSEWRANDYTGPAFRKLLVVGVSRDAIARRVFEDRLVAELTGRGVAATASYVLAPQDGELDRAALENLVAVAGADGILTTRLVQVTRQTTYYPGVYPYGPYPGPYYGFYGYYPYAYRGAWLGYAYVPPQIVQYDVVTLETQLFDVPRQALIWGATSQSFAPGNLQREAGELGRLVIAALAAARLIEAKPA